MRQEIHDALLNVKTAPYKLTIVTKRREGADKAISQVTTTYHKERSEAIYAMERFIERWYKYQVLIQKYEDACIVNIGFCEYILFVENVIGG